MSPNIIFSHQTDSPLKYHGGSGCPRTARLENNGKLGIASSVVEHIYDKVYREILSLEALREERSAYRHAGWSTPLVRRLEGPNSTLYRPFIYPDLPGDPAYEEVQQALRLAERRNTGAIELRGKRVIPIQEWSFTTNDHPPHKSFADGAIVAGVPTKILLCKTNERPDQMKVFMDPADFATALENTYGVSISGLNFV